MLFRNSDFQTKLLNVDLPPCFQDQIRIFRVIDPGNEPRIDLTVLEHLENSHVCFCELLDFDGRVGSGESQNDFVFSQGA